MSSTNLVKNNLFTKPYLLTLDEVSQIGQNMNLVGYDPQLNITSDDTNIVLKYGVPSSPKILNWVEPYKVAEIDYTLFYTEVNSGLNIGDKVFIINGTYDSNLLIKLDKYKRGRDGYKVLFIDKCKVVLDIEFNGSLPSNETTTNNDDLDDFIKVYYVKDENDFLHVNRQVTTRGNSVDRSVDFKFNKYQNNLIFTDINYSSNHSAWGDNEGLSNSPGFFIKNGTASWTNISNDFMVGSYSIAATSSNNKILILNDSFTYNGFEFKENSVYSWEYNTISATYSWVVNVKHENNNVPILTKSNFRSGTFNGTFNGGLYGSNEKRITWGSTTSFWNQGTLLNTIWEKGIMESKYSQTESYIAEFDNYGIPYQKSTNPDNDGYGYNFVINSEIRNAVINNGNVSNSVLIGTGTAANISIVEDHVKGNLTDQYIRDNFNNTLINKAYFESCGINNANIENAIIKNSRINNSRLYSVKSINCHYKSSLFKNSNYISDNIIKILDFDQFKYSSNNSSNLTHLVYKFYINKRSYEKFKFKDNFYIKGIKLKPGMLTFLETEPANNSILNFFDKKFRLGPWTEYIDTFDNNTGKFTKKPIQFNSFVSTTKENQYTYDFFDNISNHNQTGINENNKGYSLDIFIKLDISTNLINPKINSDSVNYKDIIDFSNAYIQNSDFESGIIENSNWNSGHHINYNKNLNLVNLSNENGEYNISLTQSSLILHSITNAVTNDEFELDYLKVNDIVFLNAVDYDSRGTVTGITVSNTGSGYITSTALTTSYDGSGTGLQVDIIATTIGGVLGLSYSVGSGDGYGNTTYTTSNIIGAGSGLLIDITSDIDGYLETFSVSSIGESYNIGDIVEVGTSGSSGIFSVVSITNGEVISASVNISGLFYDYDQTINIDSGDGLAQIKVIGITGSLTRLNDTYKISNIDPFIIDEIVATGSMGVIHNLLPFGIFSSYGANNRYGYLHKTKFYKSKIVSGLFRRSYIKGSLIKNDTIDISDRDFVNVEKMKSLIIADTIFSKNNNILSNAFYIFSSFVGINDIWNNVGINDIWDNGILYRSIWNGMSFNNGLVRESTWIDGTFLNGLFYMSDLAYNNTSVFNNVLNLSASEPFYNSNNIYSYYKSGLVSNVLNNNRLSWQSGTFVNGEFYKSKWEGGHFNNGKFYYSDFYSGEFNGGIIGDKSISSTDTRVFNGAINYVTVENASLISNFTDFHNSIENNINWFDGVFNDGVFSTYNNNIATWYTGTFNGGEFGDHSINGVPKWKDGIFNGGKFTSVYGISSGIFSSNISLDDIDTYSWENGVFNGGDFGFGGDLTLAISNNSTWFNGEFNGGKFKGKVWNNGIFTFGEFSGSGQNPIGGTASIPSQSNPNNFIHKFISSNNYYGLWRNGFVTDTKSKYLDKELFTDLKRSSDTNKSSSFSLLKNVLWLSGTFSHPSATIKNSVWLDGTFENGTFENGAFNPYAIRSMSSDPTFNFDDSCTWINGNFKSGEFSMSKWENGNFIFGTATGMIWKNGIVNYMNAYNVFWEDGLWRNGNWQGSYYDINTDGTVTDPYVKQILDRGMSWSGTSSCHIWSVFYKESLTDFTNWIDENATSVIHQVDINQNLSPLPPTQFGVVNAGSTPPPISGGSTKVLGSVVWSSPPGGSASRVGADTTIDVLFIGIDQFNNTSWENNNSINGTYYTSYPGQINLDGSTTFALQPGVNKFRIKGENPDNNQVYYTNELIFNKTVPTYTISWPINQTITPGFNNQTGTVVVTGAPATLTLTANKGSGGLFGVNTVMGTATISLLGSNISGSPFNTPLASSTGTSITTISIVLPSSGTYNVILSGAFTGSSLGNVKLT